MSDTAPRVHLHPSDIAPGDERADGREIVKGLTGYLVGLGLATLITVVAHLVFFLHITSGPDNVNNVLALAFGVLIVLLLIVGSLWIMSHLNHNMMPMDRIMQMQR